MSSQSTSSVGQVAPDFALPDSNGQTVKLSDFRGRLVVLYFYPKDDTPGCTLEAQGFSQTKTEYEALDAVVLGISKDSVKSHAKFCQRYGLTITLLADPDHRVIERYGAWQMKKMMGREYMGTVRMTYLIDGEGLIRQIWPMVTPADHAQEVLTALKSQKRSSKQ